MRGRDNGGLLIFAGWLVGSLSIFLFSILFFPSLSLPFLCLDVPSYVYPMCKDFFLLLHEHISTCMRGHIYIYDVHTISFQTFFVWALLLIVHTWNSSPLWSNLLWLQYTCCTVPTTSGRPHGSPVVWACQWPSS